MNKEILICNIHFGEAVLKTAPYKRRCRYHRVQGQEFDRGQIYPKGFCPHVYRIAYPYWLSLLYDSKYRSRYSSQPSRSLKIRCPGHGNDIELDIGIRYTLPFVIRKLKAAAIRLLQFFNIPGEYPDKDVIIKVSTVNGICPGNIKQGQSFKFNIRNRDELCPASFYALYPTLIQRAIDPKGATEGRKEISLHCPDPYGVSYVTLGNNANCEDFFSIKADIVEEIGNCPLGHKKGESFKFQDILPNGFCPLAFYAIFPYYLTLIHSGSFEWVRKGEHVRVQCPKVNGVVMEVELVDQDTLGKGTVRVKVIEVKGLCPRGHKKGDRFDLSSQEQALCFKAMAMLIPFKIKNDNRSRQYRCPGSENSLIFELE